MKTSLGHLWLCCGVLLLVACRAKAATNGTGEFPKVINRASGDGGYARCLQAGPDTYILQTGRRVLHSKSGTGPEIELLGVVHIAETNYYKALQRRLDTADLVLIEGVTNTNKQKANAGFADVAAVLGWVEQSSQIDEKRTKFVCHDMSMQQMQALLEAERDQGGTTGAEAAAALKDLTKVEGVIGNTSLELRIVLLKLRRDEALKAQMRARLVIAFNAEAPSRPALSPRLKRLMLEDRNAYVLSKIEPLIEKSSPSGRIVIFYGFQHLPGLETGLKSRGYLPAGPIEWEDAMTVHPVSEGLEQNELENILGMVGTSAQSSQSP